MANLPMPPNQPPPSSATILQKLLDQQIETNWLLQKSITLQQEKNKKTDLIVDALSSILRWVKNINTWMPGRIIIALFFLMRRETSFLISLSSLFDLARALKAFSRARITKG